MRQLAKLSTVILIATQCLSVATPAHAKTEWVRIGQGPNFDYARAYCDNASMGVGQGYWAYGSQAYVAGVALAYGIGNLIQQNKYFHNCMAMQGWKKVTVSRTAKSTKATAGQPSARVDAPPPKPRLSSGCANAKTMAEMQKYCG